MISPMFSLRSPWVYTSRCFLFLGSCVVTQCSVGNCCNFMPIMIYRICKNPCRIWDLCWDRVQIWSAWYRCSNTEGTIDIAWFVDFGTIPTYETRPEFHIWTWKDLVLAVQRRFSCTVVRTALDCDEIIDGVPWGFWWDCWVFLCHKGPPRVFAHGCP